MSIAEKEIVIYTRWKIYFLSAECDQISEMWLTQQQTLPKTGTKEVDNFWLMRKHEWKPSENKKLTVENSRFQNVQFETSKARTNLV